MAPCLRVERVHEGQPVPAHGRRGVTVRTGQAVESVRREPFGTTPAGEPVDAFTFASAAGVEVRVITYGAIVQSLRTPDRDGRLDDIVLGHDDVAGYQRSGAYFGAVVGRYGNRIANGCFTLEGREVQLAVNDGPNQLHGGPHGFDRAIWRAAPFEREGARGVVLTHRSPDGDQGFPGTLDVSVTYTLTDDDELLVGYEAASDRATPVNLTQHSYFNLAGAGAGNILDHELAIHAGHYTPVDERLIPTGEIAPVAGTPLDFRRPVRIGARIGDDHVQLQRGRGYDHNYVLSRPDVGLAFAARVTEPTTGRVLEVHTTEPGMQLYSGNFIADILGKGGRRYERRGGLCLETQHFPDSPNHLHFPSAILRAGAEYHSRTVFAFSIQTG